MCSGYDRRRIRGSLQPHCNHTEHRLSARTRHQNLPPRESTGPEAGAPWLSWWSSCSRRAGRGREAQERRGSPLWHPNTSRGVRRITSTACRPVCLNEGRCAALDTEGASGREGPGGQTRRGIVVVAGRVGVRLDRDDYIPCTVEVSRYCNCLNSLISSKPIVVHPVPHVPHTTHKLHRVDARNQRASIAFRIPMDRGRIRVNGWRRGCSRCGRAAGRLREARKTGSGGVAHRLSAGAGDGHHDGRLAGAGAIGPHARQIDSVLRAVSTRRPTWGGGGDRAPGIRGRVVNARERAIAERRRRSGRAAGRG